MGDAEDKLAQLAAEARAAERKLDDDEQRAKKAEREKQHAAERKQRISDRSAPGYFGQMRFFTLAGTLVFGGAALGGAWSEGANVLPLITWALPVLVIAFVVTWLDALTWRRRLPFLVTGDDVISGSDGTDSDRVPWLRVTVRIVLREPFAHPAVDSTLQVLAARVNTAMKKEQGDSFEPKQHWRVKDGVLRGEVDKSLYTTRMLEKWLRREVRLLHQVAPVKHVEVSAAYTGSSSWAPSGD